MKILLISNSYYELTLLNILDDIFPYDISQIILLQENHSKNDTFNCKHEIIISPSLLEAVNNCDIVLLFKHPHMNKELEEKLSCICETLNKKIESFCIPFSEDQIKIITTKEKMKYKELPVIMILSLGLYNQHIYTEVLINKIFQKLGVATIQLLSNELASIMQQANLKQNASRNTEDEVIIQCVSCTDIEGLLNNKELLKTFEIASPDFTIINIESGLNEKCDIKDLIERIEYRFNTKTDLVISSNFCSIRDKKNTYIPLYYKGNEHDCFLRVDDLNLENVVKREIIDKITFPKGIMIK